MPLVLSTSHSTTLHRYPSAKVLLSFPAFLSPMARHSNFRIAGGHGTSGAGNLIPKMSSVQLWRHHLDPTNGQQHAAAWFIGFFFWNTKRPDWRLQVRFFCSHLFFFDTSQQIYKNSMEENSTIYNYTHVYVTIFLFHFRWLSRLAFNKRSQKDSCTLRLLYSTVVAGRLIFLQSPRPSQQFWSQALQSLKKVSGKDLKVPFLDFLTMAGCRNVQERHWNLAA